MMRRLLAGVVLALLLSLFATAPVGAQDGVSCNPTPGAETDPPDSPPCETEVIPDEETPATTPPAVQGSTTSRLPTTGGAIGAAAILGLALTGAGITLAAVARRRRNHQELVV